MKEEIQYPDFEEIFKRCKKAVEENFPEYGNSWIEGQFTLDWWHKRIKGELKEILESKTLEGRLPEIIDLIVVLSFHYHRLALNKCAKCGKYLTTFHIINDEKRCTDCFIGK